MKFITFIFVFMALNVSASSEKEMSLGSPVIALEFNSVASQYLERPTFSFVSQRSDGTKIFNLKMTKYNNTHAGIGFDKEYVEQHIKAIGKYIEWEKIATERGDVITKEIDFIPAWKNGFFTIKNKYTFHSGNVGFHYLKITGCMLDSCTKHEMFLNQKNAEKLRSILIDFQNNEIKEINVDDVYK